MEIKTLELHNVIPAIVFRGVIKDCRYTHAKNGFESLVAAEAL